MLKKFSFYIGKLFTKNLFFGRLYLRMLVVLCIFVTKKQKNQILNHLISLDLKEAFLKPQEVTLGERTNVFIVPHKGEFDFAAILGGKFFYEEEVFSSLEKNY